VAVDSVDDILAGLDQFGAPALLKTRREGYDGKGQTWVENHADAQAALARIGGAAAILEARASFVRELSVIAARGRDGEMATYPPGENHHENGVLRRTSAPADITPEALLQVETIAARILTSLDYVGVMGVELFDMGDGRLLVNEIAPRVHNSGHWTLDGCQVDQFEQHIRAVAGWPLGVTDPLAHVVMENLLGEEINTWPALAAEQDARLWHYGKGEARPGRKMGHVNRLRGLKG
jgi:5-(carboxyamino)imidazole ribonucleotide synthase